MTADEKEQAKRDYLADPGSSYRSLAAEYGVSESVMRRALAGVARPHGGVVKARLSTDGMWQMRRAGLTLGQIARQAGITESGVWRRLNRNETGR